MTRAGFSARLLRDRLSRFPQAGRLVVGFSGGADSTALLAALHELTVTMRTPLCAIHFHHGLHPDADRWLDHCTRFCEERRIPLLTERLNLVARCGSSPELAARQARYERVAAILQPGDLFLTAHHLNDRAETLMLNLLRGSGIDGIASIPELRPIGVGWVARPLLEFTRGELESYLRAQGLTWIEDPGNQAAAPDRNFLRNELFPQLEARWPGVADRLGRTARHARETMDALAADLEARFGHWRLDSYTFACGALTQLPRVFQALLVRQWIRDRGLVPPPGAQLDELLDQLAHAPAEHSAVEVRWDGWLLRRHRHRLWLHPEQFPDRCPTREWSGAGVFELGGGFGTLSAPPVLPASRDLAVGPRRACRGLVLHARGPHRPLKDLMREAGIPPWLRDAVPVLYDGDEVLAIGDWMLSADFREWLSRHPEGYRWNPSDALLRKLQRDCAAATIDLPATVR